MMENWNEKPPKIPDGKQIKKRNKFVRFVEQKIIVALYNDNLCYCCCNFYLVEN